MGLCFIQSNLKGDEMSDSAQKRVLITGGSRGIGLAIAKLLAESHHVAVTATSQKSLNIGLESMSALGIVHQFSRESDEKQLWDKATELLGGSPDILINNAAITDDSLMLRMKKESWQSVIDVNLHSVFNLSQLAMKSMMRSKWGRIVHLSSVVARNGNIGQANYIASKCALEGLTRAMALESATRGVTVNAIAPGFIQTDMTGSLDAATTDMILSQIPMAKMGSPEDIAAAAKFLVSDGAAYITGQVLHVNGGMYLG